MRKLSFESFWRWICVASLLLMPFLASAQNHTVTGRVTDASGEPIVGAVVMIEGTQTAAVTDF